MVLNMGKTHVGHTVHGYRTATVMDDGTVVLDSDLIRTKEIFWFHTGSRRAYRRYFVISSSLMQEGLARTQRGDLSPSGARVLRAHFLVGPGENAARMFPYHYRPVPASPADLPSSLRAELARDPGSLAVYRSHDERSSPKPAVYAFEGDACEVWFSLSLPREMETDLTWWHYPVQALLIPAVPVDVVTFPIQWFVAGAIIGPIR
jgi:hypothetical protein